MGAFGGLLGAGFHHTLHFVTHLRNEHHWLIFLLPIGGLFTVALYKFLKLQNNKGTNEIIDAALDGHPVSPAVFPGIFLATATTHLFGGSALFIPVKGGEVGDAVLLQHIQKLQLGASQLGLDPIHLPRKADVDIRIGAGKDEELIREEKTGFDGKVMGLGADEAGAGEANTAVAVVDDLELTFSAGALELDHVRRQIKEADGAQNAASACGAAVSHGGALFVQYHNGFLPARGRACPMGRKIMLQASVYAYNTEGVTPKRDTLRVKIQFFTW